MVRLEFSDIVKVFNKCQWGLGLQKVPDRRRDRARKAFLGGVITNFLLLDGTIVYYSVQAPTLLSRFVNLIGLSIDVLMIYSGCTFLYYQEKWLDLLDWCRNSIGRSPLKHRILAVVVFNDCLRRSVRLFKLILAVLQIGSLISMTLPSLVGVFHGKMEFTVPVHLPFLPLNNWLFFLLNLGNQIWATVTLCLVFTMIFGTFFTVMTYIIGHLRVARRILLTLNDVPKERLNKAFLEELKTVVEMQVEVIEKTEIVKELTSVFLLAYELFCYVIIFMAWVSLDRSWVVAAVLYVVQFFLVCSVNEALMNGYADLSDAIYEINWTELTPRNRKLMIPFMCQNQNPKGLCAGSFHEVTFERFSRLMQTSYNIGVFLLDVVA